MTDNLNELLFQFIEQMKVRNYSSSTIRGYSREVRKFLEYLRENNVTDIKRITRDFLKTWQAMLMEYKARGDKGYTPATVALKIRSIKRFFEHLEQSSHILVNPAEYIKEPKKEYRLPRVVLTEDEARNILDQPNLSTMTGIRDRTLLEVLYGTGIRLEEVTNLTIYDCDLQGGLLRVNKGKFAKDRVVPLGRHAVRFLKEYITHVRPRHTRKNRNIKNLFVSGMGNPLSRKIISIIICGHVKQAGIGKKVTAHTFRHTFATQLVKNGAEITAVQKMLGHSCLSVTHIYTRVAGVDVKKTHKERHPREKDKEEKTPDAGAVELYFRTKQEDRLLIKRGVLSKQLQRKRHV